MKTRILYVILVLLIAAMVVTRMFRHDYYRNRDRGNRQTTGINADQGFHRRTAFIEYTHHARCRMDCRHITEQEVKEIMQNGSVNYRKSDLNAQPCPTYALEGRTTESQRLRIVFAQCDQSSRVVTV